MPRTRVLAAIAVALFSIAAGFALSSRPDHQVATPPAPTTTVMPAASPDPLEGLDVALRTYEDHQAAAAAEREAINQAILEALAPAPVYELPPAYVNAPRATNPSNGSYGPCGGQYPPCSVVEHESATAGLYAAYNPAGCGGAGCYGKWQFSGEWACKLGLPCDLASATPEQQDEAARILWANGAGCSNWSAC